MSTLEHDASGRETVPAAPLQALIRRDLEHAKRNASDINPAGNGTELLAARLGLNARLIYRVLHAQRITLDAADRYLLASGRLLADVYPEAYEPPGEPDDLYWAECRHCHVEQYLVVLAEGPRSLRARCPDCGTHQMPLLTEEGRRRRLEAALKRGRELYRDDIRASDVATLYRSGWTLDQLRAHYGAGMSAIVARLEEAGVKRRHQGPPPNLERIRYAVSRRGAGISFKAIGDELGVSANRVMQMVKRAQQLGIEKA